MTSSRSSIELSIEGHQDWLLHVLYTRHEFKECLKSIDVIMQDQDGICEYPLYIKALILRQNGQINESLQLFQAATVFNPTAVSHLKQVAKSLYLLGKHAAAIQVYEEAKQCESIHANDESEDWEIEHALGLCAKAMLNPTKAIDHFQRANNIQRHDITFCQLGELYRSLGQLEAALDIYLEALDFSPENPSLLTELGLTYLAAGNSLKAFDALGNAMTHDPRNVKTILAAGSVIQENQDMDVALVKYRVAAVQTPQSAPLWNNIGMCFFGKQRFVAAIASLKHALLLDPFESKTCFNIGVVHLNTGQYASAFHYFSAAINLNPTCPLAYGHLAQTLARLEDFDNASAAYTKAIKLHHHSRATSPGELPVASFPTVITLYFNYAVTLWSNDELARATEQFLAAQGLIDRLTEEARKDIESQVWTLQTSLRHTLNIPTKV